MGGCSSDCQARRIPVRYNNVLTPAMLVNIAWALAFTGLTVALPSGSLEARWANVSTAVVDLGYAQYQGTYDPDTNISYFFGVRYAQAPTG